MPHRLVGWPSPKPTPPTTVGAMTEQISVEEYAAKARVFLDANAEKKEARKKFVWGEGTDNVSMFEERSKEAEEEMLRRAKAWQALRFDNDTIRDVSRLIELHLRFFGYGDQAWSDSAVRRYVRDAGEQLTRLHALTRSDVTTRNQRKADRLAHAYDDLEQRIAALQEQEELDSIRPDLSGEDIMRILGLKPGREVGEARNFLMELRLDQGQLGAEEAEKRLLAWWSAR